MRKERKQNKIKNEEDRINRKNRIGKNQKL